MSLNQLDYLKDCNDLFEDKIPFHLLNNSLLQKDIWYTSDDLGLETHEHQKILSINFSKIQPSWLNLLSKLYVLTRANLKLSIQYINGDVSHLKKFALFLQEKCVEHPRHIDHLIFEEFDYWIRLTGVKERTISLHYTTLQNFFDTCRQERWLNVNTYWFYGRRTSSTPNNDEIDYIPEEVWNQLEENLHNLAEPIQRKILIIRTLGLRIGELLNLPLDCLRKRGDQWRLRLKETEKFKIEDEMPIPLDLVPVIKEQQEYIRQHLDRSYNKLFCTNNGGREFKFIPVAKVMCIGTFNRWLNQLAQKYNIRSKDGQVWHFSSHQFRRTVATIMTNAGVRDLIIQKYLRHRNPDMQNHYKHLLKEVIGEEYQELIKERKYVDITGKVIATHKPKDAIAEYMRRRMHQITTQVGECHRPDIKKPCPTVNACGRCQHWMNTVDDLPFLKQDLERLQTEERVADELGLLRNQKELKKDINFFQIRIQGLEEISNND